MLSIRSISSDRELIFSFDQKRDHYHVEIKSFSISASIDIPEHEVGKSLADFFCQLASHKYPWSVPREWRSCTYDPPDLRISATCTNRGHVRFRIILFAGYYHADLDAENWEASIGLETTLGELDNIARHARTFFLGRTSDA